VDLTKEEVMRTIETHKVNPANDKLNIEVLDEPGAGGACHRYRISGYEYRISGEPTHVGVDLIFQNGPINEVGVNGITHEALLAILIDRLEHFQTGPYVNEYNGAALAHLQSAQGALFDRTRERVARGVEGTHQK
jgi:hypothetical protein